MLSNAGVRWRGYVRPAKSYQTKSGSSEDPMLQSTIAEWSYYLACVSGIVAVVYRAFWFGALGARLFGAAPRVVPHNFVELSILLFVVSIASDARVIVHHQEG